MKNITKMLFLIITISSTTLTMSSQTWLGVWMGLEMNTISFTPLLYELKNKLSSESCMIYFLIQSFSSMLLLTSVLSGSLIAVFPAVIKNLPTLVLISSLMIKLGLPPLHFWFPELLNKTSWTNCTILMTWQKMAPLTVLSYMKENTHMLPTMAIVATMTGAIGGLNQTSTRKIMGYSSINHMGWMLACMGSSNESWALYLLIYSTMILIMNKMFQKNHTSSINQMMNSNPSMTEKMSITMMFLSLGGLPPFTGFFPKWMTIQSFTTASSYTIITIMIMSSLITLYYYTRMISLFMLTSASTPKWINHKNHIKNMTPLIMISNLTLPTIMTYGF